MCFFHIQCSGTTSLHLGGSPLIENEQSRAIQLQRQEGAQTVSSLCCLCRLCANIHIECMTGAHAHTRLHMDCSVTVQSKHGCSQTSPVWWNMHITLGLLSTNQLRENCPPMCFRHLTRSHAVICVPRRSVRLELTHLLIPKNRSGREQDRWLTATDTGELECLCSDASLPPQVSTLRENEAITPAHTTQTLCVQRHTPRTGTQSI